MSVEAIVPSILFLRQRKVILDSDLAGLFGVTTKRFNEQVRRNLARLPADFMFRLSEQEVAILRSQIATLRLAHGKHRKYTPYAFTEHGAIMAATILNSPRAVEMSVYVVRAFVRLRELLASNKELTRRLDELEAKLTHKLESHDQAIVGILKALRELTAVEPRAIGFTADIRKRP
jgi:phage regulator Rha-like protein